MAQQQQQHQYSFRERNRSVPNILNAGVKSLQVQDILKASSEGNQLNAVPCNLVKKDKATDTAELDPEGIRW